MAKTSSARALRRIRSEVERPPALDTERLRLRRLTLDDAPFVLSILNEPSWLRYIGDKGVRTLDAARDYLHNGPLAMYARHGFGLMLVVLKEGNVPIGLAGLIKRDALPDVDIGFALLPAYWGRGYAFEAAAASVAYGHEALGLSRIVAIVSPDNTRSTALLRRLGLSFERMLEIHGEAVALYA